MELSEALRLRIINLLKEHDISMSKMSTMSAISRSTLTKFLNGNTNMLRLDIIQYMCEAIGITIQDFFNGDEFNNIIMKE